MLNAALYIYRCLKKKIYYLKKRLRSEDVLPFSISLLTAEYDIPYETLTDNFLVAQELHEAYTEAKLLASEQEKVITF